MGRRAPSWGDFIAAHPEFGAVPLPVARPADEKALWTLFECGAKLLRFRQIPDAEAPHMVDKRPLGVSEGKPGTEEYRSWGDWPSIAAGGPGARFDECLEWLREGTATVLCPGRREGPEEVTFRLRDGERPGLGLLPASLGRVVVDMDLASKKGRYGPCRRRSGHDARKPAIRRWLPDSMSLTGCNGLRMDPCVTVTQRRASRSNPEAPRRSESASRDRRP